MSPSQSMTNGNGFWLKGGCVKAQLYLIVQSHFVAFIYCEVQKPASLNPELLVQLPNPNYDPTSSKLQSCSGQDMSYLLRDAFDVSLELQAPLLIYAVICVLLSDKKQTLLGHHA